MPKRYLSLLTFLCLSLSAFSQQFKISGTVLDTSENKPLENAVVSVLRSTDSVLLKFIRTKADGTFSVSGLSSSKNIILITYPGYADYAELLKDSSTEEISLGSIPLTPKSELLEAVIVKQQIAAIRMKGDTLEFKADSFAVRPGAAVDELLKRLPGITVNRSGEITAHGQKVNKVLVDGEEFFSDDPAVVIKNLQADAVENVQLFDKKSDQAEFTGIDDGKRSKTINLTLKEDKKKGYFVRAKVGGGTNGTFDNDIMTNAFKGSKKIAAFGIMSNTGREDLGWRENEQFGEGNNAEFDEENGGLNWSSGDREDVTQGLNIEQGLPKAWTAGLHFSNKWHGDKEKLNTNYRFYKNNQRASSQTISQYILPDTQFFNTSSRRAFSSYQRHFAKGIYDLKFDSLSSMKLTVNGNSIDAENASQMTSAALNADSARVNSNERSSNTQASKNSFTANALWRKKFKTKGRTLSVSFDQQLSEQTSDGFLNSNTNYFDANGQVDSLELIDQKKNYRQNVVGVRSSVVYTEPLSKSIFMSVNYGYTYRKTESFRTTLNKTGNVYDKRDSSLSNDFKFKYNIQSGGVDFKYNKKKFTATIGSGINYSMYQQSDLLADTAQRYSFVNYFPKMMIRWSPTQQRALNFNYNGRNNPPTLEQLQPVRENTDPLNIRIGNPDLRQEFTHTLNLFFYDFKILSNRGIFLSTNATFQDNAISQAITTDAGGKTTYQSINVDGNYFLNFNGSYGWKMKKLNINLDFGPSVSYAKNSNTLNGLQNINYSTNYGFNIYISRWTEKLNFMVRPNIGYTFAKSTLRADVVTKYFTSENEVRFWTKLPHKFEFSTDLTANFRQKTDVFAGNLNATKWDAYISKKFFEKEKLELRLSVFDILDQNIGFNRTTNSNVITQNSYQNLRRYWMLSLQFNLSKSP
ncbi:MAG: TonB-dependent receptor family protein [Chitinophagaceae bacterium]|nr:TonB-dependent receptor family protein [Chitinophagaceae bacterium]